MTRYIIHNYIHAYIFYLLLCARTLHIDFKVYMMKNDAVTNEIRNFKILTA